MTRFAKRRGWRMGISLKAFISMLAVISLGLGAPYAFSAATDATNATLRPSSMGAESGKSIGEPFVIESGLSDYNYPQSTTALDNYGAPGYQKNVLCFSPDSTQPAYCLVRVVGKKVIPYYETGGRLCPRGFAPDLMITPLKINSLGNMSFCSYAMPSASSVYGNRLTFTIKASAGVLPSGNYIPGLTFAWSVKCVPLEKVPGSSKDYPDASYNPEFDNFGSCGFPMSETQKILLWDMGVLAQAKSDPGVTNVFYTNRKCPGGYSSYVQIYSPNIQAYNTSPTPQVSASGGICIKKIEPSGATYKVTYLVNQRVVDVKATSGSLDISSLYRQGRGGDMDIPWALYCFPPGYASGQMPYLGMGDTTNKLVYNPGGALTGSDSNIYYSHEACDTGSTPFTY